MGQQFWKSAPTSTPQSVENSLQLSGQYCDFISHFAKKNIYTTVIFLFHAIKKLRLIALQTLNNRCIRV